MYTNLPNNCKNVYEKQIKVQKQQPYNTDNEN